MPSHKHPETILRAVPVLSPEIIGIRAILTFVNSNAKKLNSPQTIRNVILFPKKEKNKSYWYYSWFKIFQHIKRISSIKSLLSFQF
jgi:hypothetical protein